MGLLECAWPLGVLDLTWLPGTKSMAATLQIARPSRLTDLIWPYEVVLDGTTASEISNGKSIQIPVTSGSHSLQIRSLHIVNRHLGLASPSIAFEINDDQTASYMCQPSPFTKALARWAACLTGDRAQWITLKRLPSPDA
jgi:hypothetical protein